jgi:hypothetical protein
MTPHLLLLEISSAREARDSAASEKTRFCSYSLRSASDVPTTTTMPQT